MARLFYGNFDFEHRLADPRREPTKILKRLNAELATSWLALARDGDLIWTPAAIEVDFFLAAMAQGLPRVIPINSWDKVPGNVEFVPWGWSSDARSLAERIGSSVAPPEERAVQIANSRATSFRLEQQWNVGLDGARRIETQFDLDAVFGTLDSQERPWVIKSEFGMSGRERVRGRGLPTPADLQWLRRRLGPQHAVFYEPWVESIAEAGIQIDVPRTGSPRLVGVTPMLVDERGQYAGSLIESDRPSLLTELHPWEDAIEVALLAAAHLQELGYFGPLGIDSMQYKDRDGSLRLRPLQDINARWTMGRLSLGLARLLAPGEMGIWSHGSIDANDVIHCRSREFCTRRTIATSPPQVGGDPCLHASQLLIGDLLETDDPKWGVGS